MIYEEFITLFNRSKQIDSGYMSVDMESFQFYLTKINCFLDKYFEEKRDLRCYELLKDRAQGKTFKELGDKYNLSRQRINQIVTSALSKLRSPLIVQGNSYLNGIFTLLCSIGETEIMKFIYYLISSKHVLLLIISDDLFKKSLQFERVMKEVDIKRVKKSKPRQIKKRFCDDEEIKKAARKFLRTHYGTNSLREIADYLMKDYNEENDYGFSGKVSWEMIMNVLYEMQDDGEIKRSYGKLALER